MEHQHRPYQPIANYGVIGDMRTVALVSMSGSIDFMSFPRFDSPTIFASLLDANKGGYFSIEPQMDGQQTKQLYLPGTAVLITRFFSDDGIAEITDFMPLVSSTDAPPAAIVRHVKAIRGQISFKMVCAPRFNYALAHHDAKAQRNEVIFTPIDDGHVCLRLMADVDLHIKDNDACAEFVLKESEIAHIVLEAADEDQQNTSGTAHIQDYVKNSYQLTVSGWRKWLSQTTYKGRYAELIFRSIITLKLMTSIEFGSVVAAPTFGIPELLGGKRNWDYRFNWIRDSAFTLYAFLSLGFYDEATHFMQWISSLCQDSNLQLLYRIDGSKNGEEIELDHLEGYQGSRPIRVGNAAVHQLQTDIYGELIDTIYIYNRSHKPITYEFWTLIEKQIECVIGDWKLPDHGIWEIRGEKREFLHSRLMCWVAMDRAIKIAEQRSFPYPRAEWEQVRDEIYKDIYHNFWNEDIKAWVQYKGSDQVDASALLMPLTHYIAPLEPRWLSTMDAIEKQLKSDVLIYRYRITEDAIDGLEGEEGTFNMCSFWFIESLAKSGRVEEAVENFEKMIGYANHLGLFSEELSHKGEHLGNFPQAFTHLSLISAALELNKQLDRL
ncbi:glycoside hydrolase family 15 protein [Mucilaginibacter daejeonensis]|uniref:glycoside hydrolase family 15 protein n=1 Tax=Mucilaginibacter daejeonensis TaxID=398049 RepID=UPI001D17429C|nr:glycoside hydrolase family 15 protein [Mucilaginibacter daejeonensis]UEG53102.1 glycoside hydrolase family 15 protein [Mucilaginibacter daejeonensis]